MRADEAIRVLSGQDLVPVLEGSLDYVKELVERCLEHDVPAVVGRPPGKGKS